MKIRPFVFIRNFLLTNEPETKGEGKTPQTGILQIPFAPYEKHPLNFPSNNPVFFHYYSGFRK